MKVAYFSPLPPNSSGIADYSALLLPTLSKLIDVEIVSEPNRHAGKDCNVALYHIGNNPEAHGWIVEALRERPGLVVLHEHVLHHLVAGMTIAVGDHEGYRVAMERDSGVVGRLLAHGVIDGIVPPVWESRPMDFPLCDEILDLAEGLIVHSQTVEQAVIDRGYTGRIFRIPMPAWPKFDIVEDEEVIGVTGTIFGAFGHLNIAKRVPQLVEGFAQVLATNPDAKLLLVGSASQEIHIDVRLNEITEQYPGSIVRLPYVEETRLWSLIASCDVCVCLRYPTMGETSGIAVRALGCGRPLIVSDIGWFSELSDDIAIKVATGKNETKELADAMRSLAGDEPRRIEMGVAAERYAEGELGVERIAELYRRAIVELAGGLKVRSHVLHDVATAAQGSGLLVSSNELSLIVSRLREARI